MILAIDAGGTNIRALISKDGKTIKSYSSKTHKIGLAGFIEELLLKHKEIDKIGISFAGQVKDGVILNSPNIKVDVADIKEHFKTLYNLPLYIQNDLTCALIAEAEEEKSQDISVLYVGTGIGLGVLESGKILNGYGNLACEIGHIPYKKAPFKCGCGRYNCIENFASGQAISKWLKYLNQECEPTLEALKKHSVKSQKIAEEFELALLYAVGVSITLFNPQTLILGGGIVEANPYLVDLVKSKIKNFALKEALEKCEIKKTKLKDAPLKGALMLGKS